MKDLKFEEQTPMMKQYIKIKENHMDALLFYRLGDFYELFFDDAKTAAKELDLVLTKRGGHIMCGIPYHVADQYLSKLLKKGYHVAICDQVEDPKEAKGIVKREVTKVITPGTFTDMEFLDKTKNNYLLIIFEKDYSISLAFLDYATGDFHYSSSTCLSNAEKEGFLFRHLSTIEPSEILGNTKFLENKHWIKEIDRKWNLHPMLCDEVDLDDKKEILERLNTDMIEEIQMMEKSGWEVGPIYSLLHYILSTQKSNLDHISKIHLENEDAYLLLDETAKKNLELFENLGTGKKEGSLYKVLDVNITSMGSRKLRRWMDKPLRNLDRIVFRQKIVEEFLEDFIFLDDIRQDLKEIYDVERLSVKIATETITPKELVSLKQSIYHIRQLKEKCAGHKGINIASLGKKIPNCQDVFHVIDEVLIDDVPAVVAENRIVRKGYDERLDYLFDAREKGQKWMLDLEARERERTGIKNLKIKYNKILGYYIEVTKTNIDKVPDSYIRKQTLVGSERYFTMELKNMESDILSSKEEALEKQEDIIQELRKKVHGYLDLIQEMSSMIATIDVLSSFAIVARKFNYTKPTFNNNREIHIINGRHPMVEANISDINFVPNDVHMNMDDLLISIITGPNMAGKSTYMRQTAIIAIMAHMGSFIPADQSNLCLIDQIFTRIGASDNLSAGESTFMVEMKEVASIIKHATADSLVILDEVGRGTGTLDGLSIAWALVEFLHEHLRVKTLFATHYHQLTSLEESMNSVQNLGILTEQKDEGITFLRKIIHGATNDSFGIEVAHLAGVSRPVIERAKEIFQQLEKVEKQTDDFPEPTLFTLTKDKLENPQKNEIIQTLANLNINEITPLESLNLLEELVRRSKTIQEE